MHTTNHQEGSTMIINKCIKNPNYKFINKQLKCLWKSNLNRRQLRYRTMELMQEMKNHRVLVSQK